MCFLFRFIKKSGHCNVSHKHLKDKSRRFLADIFTTGVDLQWRYNLLVFSTTFILRYASDLAMHEVLINV